MSISFMVWGREVVSHILCIVKLDNGKQFLEISFQINFSKSIKYSEAAVLIIYRKTPLLECLLRKVAGEVLQLQLY